LAEGLGHPRVLEVCANFPSVVCKTPNGRPVVYQRFFEKAIDYFMKSTEPKVKVKEIEEPEPAIIS